MCNTEDFLHYDYVRLAWDIGFSFEEYDSKSAFDLGLIGLVDVDRVAKERDIPTVVKHIPTLLNFRLDNDIGKVLEPNFIKLFRLSQLSIQYLRFCRKYLDTTVALLKDDIHAANADKEEVEGYLEELKLENDSISRKYEELKTTLSTSIYKCEECAKTFYSEEYLFAHVKRRHEPIHYIQMQTESDKLQLEIKELKQRLNNTERLILKEDKEDKKTKDGDNEKEKEEESVEPNNDAFVDDTIQYKFEQLKNHIEAEINSLKNEDFYRDICEKYIKERVERKLSISTTQGPSTEVLTSHENLSEGNKKKTPSTESKNVSDAVVEKIDKPVKATESFTQTDLKAVSEGTSMSPQPTPRKIKPQDDGDNKLIGENIGASIPGAKGDALPQDNSIMIMEQKLAREVELQRETLEHILDLKLSGSLNKMEAQMTAFWDKLNAWESNLTRPTQTISTPGLQANSHKESFSNGEVTTQKMLRSIGSVMNSPVKVVPKVLSRQLGTNDNGMKERGLVVKSVKQMPKSAATLKATMTRNDLSKFLESSEEDTVTEEESEKSNSEDMSVEEKPSNIKPSASFRRRLDETLLQRLKPQEVSLQVKQQPNIIEAKPRVSKPSESPRVESHEKQIDNFKSDEEGSIISQVSSDNKKSIDSSETNFQDLKKRLKKHVGQTVDQKLKDMGVSPHWRCLPEKSYTKAIEIVEHQATLTKKMIPDFYKIRKNIERTIDKELEKGSEGLNIRRNKRSASAILPTMNLSNNKKQQEKISSIEPTPPESNPTESSLDIPLQRVPARPIIKATLSRRQTTLSSPINQPLQSPTKPTFLQSVEVHPVQTKAISPELASATSVKEVKTAPSAPAISKSDHSITLSSPSAVPLISSKKKVLFNLDSESDHSHREFSPEQNVIVNFVKHEKAKLGKQELTKSDKTDLHTESESSDWDISDIT